MSPQAVTHPAPSRRSTILPGPKLRDSCHACAASKVKCNKGKPTCSRCEKRNAACEYVATKRAGRKHDSRLSNTTSLNQALPGPSQSTSEMDTLTSPNLTQPSPRYPLSGDPENVPNPLSPTDPAWLSTLTTDFSDFPTSPMSFSIPDTFDFDFLAQSSGMRQSQALQTCQ